MVGHDGARVEDDLEHRRERSARSRSSRSATTSCAWRWAAWSRTSRRRTCRRTRTRTRRIRARCSSRRSASKVPEIRFSTLGHRVLWADANESEQTVISYMRARQSASKPGAVDWIRREQRRPSNQPPEEAAERLRRARPRHRQARSSSSGTGRTSSGRTRGTRRSPTARKAGCRAACGSRSRQEPRRPRTYKLTTEARILMQEPLNFVP